MEYTYIERPEGLKAAIDRLSQSSLLGVDTEAAGYHRYHDRISLLQVSSRDENILVDPIALEDLSSLRTLFADPGIEKIFHDADFDLRILDRDLGLHIQNLFDTQVAAAFVGERSLGLGAIVERCLGTALPKAYQRADWAERPLSEGMKEYAATDTAYLPALRDRLLEELDRLGRTHWAQEEFAHRQRTRWTEADDAAEPFLRVKGARDLSRRGLAVLREIYRWRDEVGRERDLATFRVLSNQAMLEIALKAPETSAALRSVGGVSDGLLGRRGQDILTAVRRGLAVADSDLPQFPPSRRWERDPEREERAERLRKARNQAAEDLGLDPGFLISRAVLDEVARRNPASVDELSRISEVRNWQTEALGDRLIEALKA